MLQISVVCTVGPEIWDICTLAHTVKEGSRVCAMELRGLECLGMGVHVWWGCPNSLEVFHSVTFFVPNALFQFQESFCR